MRGFCGLTIPSSAWGQKTGRQIWRRSCLLSHVVPHMTPGAKEWGAQLCSEFRDWMICSVAAFADAWLFWSPCRWLLSTWWRTFGAFSTTFARLRVSTRVPTITCLRLALSLHGSILPTWLAASGTMGVFARLPLPSWSCHLLAARLPMSTCVLLHCCCCWIQQSSIPTTLIAKDTVAGAVGRLVPPNARKEYSWLAARSKRSVDRWSKIRRRTCSKWPTESVLGNKLYKICAAAAFSKFYSRPVPCSNTNI